MLLHLLSHQPNILSDPRKFSRQFPPAQNQHFLPLSSTRVKRAKTTEEIFIFHDCSLHKLKLNDSEAKQPKVSAPPPLPFFPPKQRSVIWNTATLWFYSEPPSLSRLSHTMETHLAHVSSHTYTRADRWARARTHTRTRSHASASGMWVRNVISCAGCRRQGGGVGGGGWLLRLTPIKSHVQLWRTAQACTHVHLCTHTKALAFIWEYTHADKEGRGWSAV